MTHPVTLSFGLHAAAVGLPVVAYALWKLPRKIRSQVTQEAHQQFTNRNPQLS